MTAAATRHQRSGGEAMLRVGPHGVIRLREAGAAKVRLPAGGQEAILINTGGGLAGGDRFNFDVTVDAGAALTVTGQAAERAYRSLGEAAKVTVALSVGDGAALLWLPQETILFDGAALSRTITAALSRDSRLLIAESFVLGRTESGEVVRSVTFHDRWRIRCGGRLAHAEDLALDGLPPATAATLGGHLAFATVLLVAPDAEALVDRIRPVLGEAGAASAWNGKLVARLAARDGFALRKTLVPALMLLAGGVALPKAWSM